jgi:hypothetical protein
VSDVSKDDSNVSTLVALTSSQSQLQTAACDSIITGSNKRIVGEIYQLERFLPYDFQGTFVRFNDRSTFTLRKSKVRPVGAR